MTATILASADWTIEILGLPLFDAFLCIGAVCLILFGLMSVYAGVATLAERKVAGHMQHRVGPHRVGPHGVLQWIADSIKLILKEDLMPVAADRTLFRTAPYIVMAASFAVFVALPYAPGWGPAGFNIGILYILAIGSAAVLGILMAGWSSGSKWSLFGAMRSAAQIVSYEVPAGIIVVTMLLVAGTLDMQKIVLAQTTGLFGWPMETEGGYGPFSWFVFRFPPVGIIAFLVFYTAALAETNRTPFDIPEADSELVAGFHTEYSGMRFAFFFLAEYGSMFALSAVGATLFLGGWLPPFANLHGAGLGLVLGLVAGVAGWVSKRHLLHFAGWFLAGAAVGVTAGTFAFADRTAFLGQHFEAPAVTFLEGFFWFASKTLFLVFVMMWLRWTVPRYRVDQLMDLCWKKLTPLAFLLFAVIGALELGIPWLHGQLTGGSP